MKRALWPLSPSRRFASLFAVMVLAMSVMGADSGKIKGRIVDAESGEPVIGANIVVLESMPRKGASTDLDGKFYIFQVPIGSYDVEVSFVGYHKITVTEVMVTRDLNTELGAVQLTPSSMKLETVTFVAQKKQIKLDQAGQTLTVTSEDIQRAAVSDATEIIAKMPGFKIDDEGKLHARGGRDTETKFVINGIDARDPLVGGQSFVNLDVANIEHLDVLSGGFGPEYGQAQAAVIKVSTKEGQKDSYHGKVEWKTDQAIDAFSFNTDQLSFNWGGPLPFQSAMQKHRRSTFFVSGSAYLTDTYLPFDVDRGSWDYVNLGLDIPERQKNEYNLSMNLAFPLTDRSKIKLYGSRFFRRWDLYPEGEGAAGGNYGYAYLYNVRNRPHAENNRNSLSLTYTTALSDNSQFEAVLYRSQTRTVITPGDRSPGDFTLEFSSQERAQEDAKSAFLGYQDLDGNGFFDGYVDANNNGAYDGYHYDVNGNPIFSEGYEDLNRNGMLDAGEDWIDLNGNGVYDAAESFTNIPNPTTGENNVGYDPWDLFVDTNGNGRWDDAEPQTPEQDTNHNGRWDGERFQDANGDGIWNGWHEAFVDENGNGVWDEGESFTDSNDNGRWDMAEGFDDVNADGRINFQDVRDDNEDLGEPFEDGDIFADTGEPFIDQPDPLTGRYNGEWDDGEIFFDLPSTEGRFSRWLKNGAQGSMPEAGLNGHYDGPNFIFDEYELFTHFADFVADPFVGYHQDLVNVRDVAGVPDGLVEDGHFHESVTDVSRPVVYEYYNLNLNGSDWPMGSLKYLSTAVGSTWGNRSDSPEAELILGGSYFDPPNNKWDEWENFTDFNGNGEQDGGIESNFTTTSDYGFQYNQPGYYDFFLNPETFDTQAMWQEREATTWSLKTEYQLQANKYHDILTGFELLYRDMEMQSIEEPQIPYDGLVPLPAGSPYPDRGNFRDFYHRKPLEGALYFRDRMEFEGLNVLIGLRWDFLMHEDSFVSETEDEANAGSPGAIEANPSTSRTSPRLGISHPITDQAKLYFNYGHFYQAPSYQYYYREATGARANNIVVGNPNLNYEKTVEYQFGIEARFEDIGTTVNIQGYYRDIFDQVTSTSVEIAPGYTIDRFTNGDYGRSRGVNLSLEKADRHYATSVNYELSFAFGKASAAREASEARVEGRPTNREEHPLAWDQTHSLNIYYSLFYDQGDHPQLFGMTLPDDWMLSISTSYGSGRPYTPSVYTMNVDNSAKIDINSERMPWTERTDMKFEKYFRLGQGGHHHFVTGFEIRNVFDKQNVRSLYSQTGNSYIAMHGENPDYTDYYPEKSVYDANPRNFDSGRNVLMKIGYQF
jgi:outer membrane receptor for ferrienterochelin and colicin